MVILLGVMAITGFLSAFVRLGARIGAALAAWTSFAIRRIHKLEETQGKLVPMIGKAAMIKPYDAKREALVRQGRAVPCPAARGHRHSDASSMDFHSIPQNKACSDIMQARAFSSLPDEAEGRVPGARRLARAKLRSTRPSRGAAEGSAQER